MWVQWEYKDVAWVLLAKWRQLFPKPGISRDSKEHSWKDSSPLLAMMLEKTVPVAISVFRNFSWAWSLTSTHMGSFSTRMWWTVLRVSKSHRKLLDLLRSCPYCWIEWIAGVQRLSEKQEGSGHGLRSCPVSCPYWQVACRPPLPSNARHGSGAAEQGTVSIGILKPVL